MFATSDQHKTPRVFQKPNILRKRPKCKEAEAEPVAAAETAKRKEAVVAVEGKHHCSKPGHITRKSTRIQLDSYECEQYRQRKLRGASDASRQKDAEPQPATGQLQNVYQEEKNVNVQLILTSQLLQEQQLEVDQLAEQTYEQLSSLQENADFSTAGTASDDRLSDITIQLAPYLTFDSLSKLHLTPTPVGVETPSVPVASSVEPPSGAAAAVCADERGRLPCPAAPCAAAFLTHRALSQHLARHHSKLFECEVEGCGRAFASPEAARAHGAHGAPRATAPRRVMLDCPARGSREEPYLCEAVFHCREHLARHLKEDHTDEDAVHRCDTCQRKFFWFSGLRAHMRVHETSARTIYACLWPDCGRVFLQACRLKEHSRQHTGDKPYPCLYPSCGWAFRTASKLLRHARRHTGERRFRCRLCARAFLRAEHLREHEARHTKGHGRHKHPCTQPGCEQRFSNKSSLYLHVKKMHPPPPPPPPPRPPTPPVDFTFQPAAVPDWPEDDCRAARTHVPWPIAPGAHRGGCESDAAERTDGDRERVYSDLFLRGDTVLQHDDTQQLMEAGLELVLLAGGGGYASDALHLDNDLGLLDSTDPINHLLQEELMLAADSCVDESPFQVLLLNGDEGR